MTTTPAAAPILILDLAAATSVYAIRSEGSTVYYVDAGAGRR